MAKFSGGTRGNPGRSLQMGQASILLPGMCRVRCGGALRRSTTWSSESISPLAVCTAIVGMLVKEWGCMVWLC